MQACALGAMRNVAATVARLVKRRRRPDRISAAEASRGRARRSRSWERRTGAVHPMSPCFCATQWDGKTTRPFRFPCYRLRRKLSADACCLRQCARTNRGVHDDKSRLCRISRRRQWQRDRIRKRALAGRLQHHPRHSQLAQRRPCAAVPDRYPN